MVKKHNSTVQKMALVVSVSIITKLIGLVKQIIISYYFGMTGETDAFLLISGTVNDIGTALFSSLAVVYLADYIRIKKERNDYLNTFTSNVMVVYLSLMK